MKPCLLIVMTTLFACSISQARLGENAQQIEVRYGKPLDGVLVPSGPEYSQFGDQLGRYAKDAYRISIVFHEGKSVYESFQKTDVYGITKLTNTDVEYLLGANAGDSTWTKQKDGLRWKRGDGAVMASINTDRTHLIIHLVQAARNGI